jgi:UDPglucose 6-dehydrogenase
MGNAHGESFSLFKSSVGTFGMNIGIVGLGVVGKAMSKLFPNAVLYDEPMKLGSRSDINLCDVVFVCVPTPGTAGGVLNTSVVNSVVSWINSGLIILRSTVNPGTTDALKTEYKKRIVFQPEYLGESVDHPLVDPRQHSFLLFGGAPADTRLAIEAYQQVYNSSVRIRQMDALSAEIIKLAENRAIAHKIAEIQELYDLCEAAGVDYYLIREAVYGDDPRMSLYWTFVYPRERGFNSKCIPKDVCAIAAYARTLGIQLRITESILERNGDYINLTQDGLSSTSDPALRSKSHSE